MTDEKKLLLAQTIFSIKEEMEKKISGEVTKIHDLYELDFKKIEDLLSEKCIKTKYCIYHYQECLLSEHGEYICEAYDGGVGHSMVDVLKITENCFYYIKYRKLLEQSKYARKNKN